MQSQPNFRKSRSRLPAQSRGVILSWRLSPPAFRARPEQGRGAIRHLPRNLSPRQSRRPPNKVYCRSSPISLLPSLSCPTKKFAARAEGHSEICCSPSRASPVRALHRVLRAVRSSAGSIITASASSRTASRPAARRISARIISCRSIRSRPTRWKSFADRLHFGTARRQSAASSAAQTTVFQTPYRPARRRRSRPMVSPRKLRWQTWVRRHAQPSKREPR